MNGAPDGTESFLVYLIERYGVLGLWFSTFLESIGIPFTSAVVCILIIRIKGVEQHGVEAPLCFSGIPAF